MAGSKDVWGSRALRRYEQLRSNKDYVKRFRALPKVGDPDFQVELDKLNRDFNIPAGMWDLPFHQLIGGGKGLPNYSKAIHVKADDARKRVILELHPETTKSDVEYFLSRGWTKEVAPLLDKYRGKSKRVPRINYDKRNSEIRTKRSSGVSVTDLAIEYDLSTTRISQILKD